jgi:hypothetical protein
MERMKRRLKDREAVGGCPCSGTIWRKHTSLSMRMDADGYAYNSENASFFFCMSSSAYTLEEAPVVGGDTAWSMRNAYALLTISYTTRHVNPQIHTHAHMPDIYLCTHAGRIQCVRGVGEYTGEHCHIGACQAGRHTPHSPHAHAAHVAGGLRCALQAAATNTHAAYRTQ